jgi:RNA polymerase sigma-70 factor (ECF subfamily)
VGVLDDELATAVAAARRAWPTVDVEDAIFVVYLRERLPDDADAMPALRRLHVADLYLACACVRGLPAALALFERERIAPAVRAAARVGQAPASVADLRQRLHAWLFDATRPRIRDYAGRGPLGGWLRVAASRLALEAHRPAEASPAPPIAGAEPDVDALRFRDGDEVLCALERALAGLPATDRELLRLHYVEGVAAAHIGERHGCDAATAATRVAAARSRVLAETRRELAKLGSRRTDAYPAELAPDLEGRLQMSLTMVLERSN